LKRAKEENIPTILRYKTHADRIFNTPPVFAVYLANYVFEWIQEQGGLEHFAEHNQKKAKLLYSEIDRDDFYRGFVEPDSRSVMNATFGIHNKELEELFLKQAKNEQLLALKGHRSVGGLRASMYNACSLESVETLTAFMRYFRDKKG